jgi:ribosomal protein S18 acetylase RimI-like enzyme
VRDAVCVGVRDTGTHARSAGVLDGIIGGMITIRGYVSGDGEGLRTLWLDVGCRLIGDDDGGLERFAARNPGLLFVAEDVSGRIVGSTMAAWDGRRGWLYHVATATEHRRTGLGRELVERAEAGLRALGAPRVLVIVESSNASALEFWRALGYEIRETRQLGKAL